MGYSALTRGYADTLMKVRRALIYLKPNNRTQVGDPVTCITLTPMTMSHWCFGSLLSVHILNLGHHSGPSGWWRGVSADRVGAVLQMGCQSSPSHRGLLCWGRPPGVSPASERLQNWPWSWGGVTKSTVIAESLSLILFCNYILHSYLLP